MAGFLFAFTPALWYTVPKRSIMPSTTMQEIEAIIKETQALQKENAEGMRVLRETQAENAAQQKTDREQWEAQFKASREAAEKSGREVDQRIKEVTEQLGGMGNSKGVSWSRQHEFSAAGTGESA
jgi:thymidylate synthase